MFNTMLLLLTNIYFAAKKTMGPPNKKTKV